MSRVKEPTEPGGISVSIFNVAPSNWSDVALPVTLILTVTCPSSEEELFLILPDTIQIGRRSPLSRKAELFRISPSKISINCGLIVAGALFATGAGGGAFAAS